MRNPFFVSVALLAATGLLATSCNGDSSATAAGTSTTTEPAPAYTPKFTEGPCAVEIPAGTVATCGVVTVPEDRMKANGNTVTLPIIRIHSRSATPKADPVVYLHGGPGSSTLHRGLATRVTNPVLDERDLIVFDQRGSGFSTPSLNCPEREGAFLTALEKARPFNEELTLFETALKSCHDRLIAQGIDLSHYNSEANAADVADIRVALGIKEWNLWGVSYGTRLALSTMRSYPDGIRSVVLDSVYPPSAASAAASVKSGQHAFDSLAMGCASDPTCHANYPDVAADLTTLTANLNATPFGFDYTMPDGSMKHFELDGGDAVAGLFNAMYDTSLIPILPQAIHAMANGAYGLIPTIADQGIPFVNDMDEGAFLSFECSDNGARIDPKEVASLRTDPGPSGFIQLVGWNLFCDTWTVKQLPESYGDTVKSSIPTLVIAGEYDPITDPRESKRTADALSDSVFIEVPHGGHGPGPDTECSRKIFTQFFDQLTAVDTACVASIVPTPFA